MLICLLVLALPATAFAVPRDRGDGTLVVRAATGKVAVTGARGTVLGHLDRGQVLVYDRNPFDTAVPEVFGADKEVVKTAVLTVYTGTEIRFRFVGARGYSIRVVGTGIDLSAVGQGKITLVGAGTLADGEYSVDGGAFEPLPETSFTGTFGQLAAPAVGG